jgi:hypothetical protein
MKLEHIKDLIQSCNINFLIGSGASNPYLSTLGNIEILLTELSKQKLEVKIYNLIKASLYKIYCETVMFRNIDSEIKKYQQEISIKKHEGEKNKYEEYIEVLDEYKNLLLSLNEILLFRYNNLLTKQVNLFSTNIDLFVEKALEETGLEFNDGFKGRLKPVYNLSNFQKSYSKTSSHYDNLSEIPVFNLLKLHGSVNWEKTEKQIIHSRFLIQLIKVKDELNKITTSKYLTISNKTTFEELIQEANKIEDIDKLNFESFFNKYDKLLIVNPTKEKFKTTVFDEQFYELLRIYANSLEKENTLLFTLGFSFADEHIKQITVRAADSNPTLQVIVFAYCEEDIDKIKKELGQIKNNNIHIMDAAEFIKDNTEKDDALKDGNPTLKIRLKNFDCKSINQEIFSKIKGMVRSKQNKL